jgi:tetratricopeptide (TPR) repeat protein
MKLFANIGLIVIMVWVHLSFTACTKSKKAVHISPDSSKYKREVTKKSPNVREKVEEAPEKNKPGEQATILEKEKMKDSGNRQKLVQHPAKDTHIQKTHTIPDILKPQSRLRFTTRKKSIILDAGECPKIVVYLENNGSIKEENLKINISGFEGKNILKSAENLSKTVDAILPGQKKRVIIPIEINPEIEDQTLLLKISMVKGKSDKPSILEIKTICRSKEERLYADISRKSRINNENRIAKCVEYIEKYKNGRYTKKIENLLEHLRWKKVQTIYRLAVAGKNVKKEAINEIENIYLAHYGMSGSYSTEAAKMFYELLDFQRVFAADTYHHYREFTENYKKSPLARLAASRGTLKYWQQKEQEDPDNSHIWCQLALASMVEKGPLGYQDAKKYFIKVISADRYNETAYIGLGKILESRENWRECIEYLNHKRPKEHENHKIYYFLGYAYERLGNQDRALSLYTKAIDNIEKEIKKEIKTIKQARYIDNSTKTKAIVNIKRNLDYLKYLYNRALIYRVMPDFDRAKRDFNTIIEIAPATSHWAKSAKEYVNGMK